MRTLAAIGLVTTALTLLTACGDDAAEDAGDYDSWCAAFDEYAVTLNEVVIDNSTPPDLQSEAVQELERMSEAFMELPVPEPIREDFDAALPRSLERPFPDGQVRARADLYGWIVENCELSDELDAELQRQVADDREYLAGIPATTGLSAAHESNHRCCVRSLLDLRSARQRRRHRGRGHEQRNRPDRIRRERRRANIPTFTLYHDIHALLRRESERGGPCPTSVRQRQWRPRSTNGVNYGDPDATASDQI